MKHLYLLRHGEADPDGPVTWSHDSARPLNEKGREKMAAQARGMKRLGLVVQAVVTSPYVRARQTAEAVAAEYALVDRLSESDLLQPGATLADLRRSLRGVQAERVMVVGHAPDLGRWLGELIGADEVPLGKGCLAWIRLEDEEIREGRGSLKGLLPADLQARAGELR